MLQPQFLDGEKVRLTALTDEDIGIVAGWLQDPNFLRLLDARVAVPQTEEGYRKYVHQVGESASSMVFAIRLIGDDRLIGTLELDGILWNQGVTGMSVAIGERQDWGKGYGGDALRLGLKFAFDELNLRRVQLTVFAYNKRAIGLYENAGFTREGTFREFLERDGQTFDMYLYGLLRREWKPEHES